MKPYDFLALVPIVQGAGGAITNWRVRFVSQGFACHNHRSDHRSFRWQYQTSG